MTWRRWARVMSSGLIVLSAWLISSIAHAQASSAPSHIAMLLEEWRVEEAASEADALAKAHPGDPDTLIARAAVRYQLGDYAGALADLDAVLKTGRAGEDVRGLRALIASTESAVKGFAEARSPDGHIVVRYTGRDKILLPYVFETIGAARREIAGRDFDALALLGDPIRVEIYPTVKHLSKVSTLTEHEIETSGTIALCKWNKLMIVSPRALVLGYPWLDTLAHEFTHFVVSRASRGTVPVWLQEGLAKFEERRWRQPPGGALPITAEHLLAAALAPKSTKRLITFEEMYPSMAKLPSQADTALAFAEVYTVVEYLHERKGWDGVRAVIDRMRAGQGDAGAVAAVLGESYDDFVKGWKTWLRGRHLREHRGLVPTSLKFSKAKDGKSVDSDDDTADITEEKVRRFARLGGLLRTQKRLPEAAVEYEKARAASSEIHLPVAHKLARTYIEMGAIDRALAVAEPAFELYPESGGLAVTLGEAWQARGDHVKAVANFTSAIQVNPFDPLPHCRLAQLLEEGDAKKASERDACTELTGAPQ